MRMPQRIFLLLIAVSLIQVVAYYPQLNEPIASHFNGAGNPNGWSSRNGFFGMYVGIIVLVAASFLYAPLVSTRASRRVANLPNKEYWLAPERRDQTWCFVTDQLVWFGVVTCVLMIGTIQMCIYANLNPPARLSSGVSWLLVAYFSYTLLWLTALFVKFNRVPKNQFPTAN